MRGLPPEKLLREAGDGEGFAVVGVEHGHELRDLKDFLELGAQVGELQSGALRAGAVEGGHQGAEAGAVDVADLREVEHDFLFAGCEKALHLFAERVAFFAQHNASFDLQHGYAINFPIRHSQCHVRASWNLSACIWIWCPEKTLAPLSSVSSP